MISREKIFKSHFTLLQSSSGFIVLNVKLNLQVLDQDIIDFCVSSNREYPLDNKSRVRERRCNKRSATRSHFFETLYWEYITLTDFGKFRFWRTFDTLVKKSQTKKSFVIWDTKQKPICRILESEITLTRY